MQTQSRPSMVYNDQRQPYTVVTHLSGPVHLLSGNEFFGPGGPLNKIDPKNVKTPQNHKIGQHFRKHHKIDTKEGKTPQNQ